MTNRKQPIQETPPAPPYTVFGGGFLPENHIEGDKRNLPVPDSRFADFVKSLRDLVSDETSQD